MNNLRRDQDTVAICGDVNEEFDANQLATLISEAHSDHSIVKVDFSDVKFLKSEGVAALIEGLDQVEVEMVLVHCPVRVVELLNILAPEFLKQGTSVVSFQAPYYHKEGALYADHLLQVGKDIPLQASYQGFQPPSVELSGRIYEPDFDPEQYFDFLVLQHRGVRL